MNRHEADILTELARERCQSQRELAERTGLALGAVNRELRSLRAQGLVGEELQLHQEARELLNAARPKRAILLAAGPGMRMVPINRQTPKPLLVVHGEVLIGRLIRQLREVGVEQICVVTGFLQEQFEYLIDDFGVDLIVNPEYAVRNNLYSLHLAARYLEDAYIVPCDLWCRDNPFRCWELYSWYLAGREEDPESALRLNRRMELVPTVGGESGSRLYGIAYLRRTEAEEIRRRVEEMCLDRGNDELFWEAAMEGMQRRITARIAPSEAVVEINTYEQLRELDANSNQLHSDALETIAAALHAGVEEIRDIRVLKKGMTNRSFLFSCKGQRYIMRIPGEGTDRLINRRQEAQVYDAIAGKGLCDDPVYLNPENGYKITRFLEGVRCCDAENEADLRLCMEKLRAFHEMQLQVPHSFDLFGQINFYESLWNGAPSAYRDYEATKAGVLSLRPYIEAHRERLCLTHIDAVPDNFLFAEGAEGKEQLQLTDWEYAGMQDPHVDIAMFCIYSLYDRSRADRLIDMYFMGACPRETRWKIYCYIAVCGLLWSNWCEYKRSLGVEFGEYSLRQYRYAKDFTRLVQKEWAEDGRA